MQTDNLIAQLAERAEPVPSRAVARFLAAGIGVGLVIAAILMLSTLGLRPDLAQAVHGGTFWMKSTYTAVIAVVAIRTVERSGRPGTRPGRPVWLLALPILFIVAIAIWELAQPGADRHHLIMGDTAKVCSSLIAYLSLPLLAAIFWVLRSLAPTRLVEAGAAAGLLSGSAAASVYAFHCPETAASFVAIWYSAGILLSTALGAFLGRWALRW